MENFRSNRSAVIGVVVVALVLVLGLVAWLVRGASDDEASSESSVSAANDASSDLGVVAGAGGSRVGPDDVTGLGYEDTCKGAVEAAASYAKVLSTRDLHAGDNVAKTVEQITANGSFAKERKDYTSMAVLRQGMSKEELKSIKESRDTFHPNWSGKYLVRDCTPGKSATISITGVLETVNTVEKQTTTHNEYITATYELVWQENDWKAQSLVTTSQDVRDPLLDKNLPAPTQADTTVSTWDKDHFAVTTKKQERIVMNSDAFAKAFDGVSPDITRWYNFSEAN